MLSIHKLVADHARYFLDQAEGRVDVVESIGEGVEEYYAGVGRRPSSAVQRPSVLRAFSRRRADIEQAMAERSSSGPRRPRSRRGGPRTAG